MPLSASEITDMTDTLAPSLSSAPPTHLPPLRTVLGKPKPSFALWTLALGSIHHSTHTVGHKLDRPATSSYCNLVCFMTGKVP